MIERYHRVYVALGDREATVGIEQRPGDSASGIGSLLKCRVRRVLRRYRTAADWILSAQADMERLVLEWFPGRAFFFEFEEDGLGVQVYNPFNLPKQGCNCEPH